MVWATFLSHAESLGISSTTFTQCAAETTRVGQIRQSKGNYAVQGHSRLPILVPTESSYTTSYYWLILTFTSYLALFPRYSLRYRSKIAIFGYTPHAFNPPVGGGPWDDLRKIFRECQRTGRVPRGVEKLSKILTTWLGARALQTDHRQTDDRRTGGSI